MTTFLFSIIFLPLVLFAQSADSPREEKNAVKLEREKGVKRLLGKMPNGSQLFGNDTYLSIVDIAVDNITLEDAHRLLDLISEITRPKGATRMMLKIPDVGETSITEYTFTREIKRGMEGLDVTLLKVTLIEEELLAENAMNSNVFDEKTEDALKQYGERYEVTPDEGEYPFGKNMITHFNDLKEPSIDLDLLPTGEDLRKILDSLEAARQKAMKRQPIPGKAY